jgi:hypothetical protein
VLETVHAEPGDKTMVDAAAPFREAPPHNVTVTNAGLAG